MKRLLGLSIALHAMDLSNSWFVLPSYFNAKPSYCNAKPNRISQKKRRLNQRRKGK